MIIEKWRDTAFGSDYGRDFCAFLEGMTDGTPLCLTRVYQHSNLQMFLERRKAFIFAESMEDMTIIHIDGLSQTIHYEDAIIALSAVMLECQLNGSADMTLCYGRQTLKFSVSFAELTMVGEALRDIYDYPDAFTMFQLLGTQERQETLADIADMLSYFQQLGAIEN